MTSYDEHFRTIYQILRCWEIYGIEEQAKALTGYVCGIQNCYRKPDEQIQIPEGDKDATTR